MSAVSALRPAGALMRAVMFADVLLNRTAAALAVPGDLVLRLWLAHGFVVSGLLKLSDWDTALRLATYEYPVSWLPPAQAAAAGMVTELLGGLLLALGLATRPAALALAALTLVVQIEYRELNIHLYSMLLLAWFALAGARGMSLDQLLGKGAGDSALPGGRTLHRAYALLDRWGVPSLQLLIRLAVAAVLLTALGKLGAEMLAGIGYDPQPLAMLITRTSLVDHGNDTLLAYAAAFGAWERWIMALAAIMIALGLGTRLGALAALGMLVGEAFASPPMPLEYAELLGLGGLALLLSANGAGVLSLDAGLALHVRRELARLAAMRGPLPHVVVVGAGFGGLACVHGLRHAPCRITLIDQNNYHLFQPLLYQVATAGLSPADIATPVRELLRAHPNVTVRMGRATGVDPNGRQLQLDERRIGYDYLVLATGARHSYFGQDGWEPHAPGLKRIEDAIEVRRRLLLAFEKAENATARPERDAWMTFVIVGGGPTGVELAGAIAELARHGMAGEFREIDPSDARVLLVQSADRLLPNLPAALSATTQRSLESLGIEVMLNSRVEHIDDLGVSVSGASIPARTVMWAAGVAASPAADWLGAGQDRAGRVIVDADLSVPGHPDVYAIGDTALSTGWNGQAVPGLAPAAKQGGAYVAKAIRARLAGDPPPRPFRYRHLGSLATIGRKSAVADFGWAKLSGPIAWWFWGAVHVLFLASLRNRAAVAGEWVWAYLTFRRSTRLITGGSGPSPGK